jgi:hypothetical protein
MSGGRVLEDQGYIAGRNIPIVPVYGKRWFVDNVERCMGHVRLAKDPQRLKNMQLSKLGEISAVSSVEKPIFVPEQVSGHQVMWAEDSLKNYPYLLVNPITGPNGESIDFWITTEHPLMTGSQPALPVPQVSVRQIDPEIVAALEREAGAQVHQDVAAPGTAAGMRERIAARRAAREARRAALATQAVARADAAYQQQGGAP